MSVSFSPESLQETKRSLQRKAQREKTLAEFIEPAAINAESEVTRALLVAETDARILGLQRESALCLLPNLVSAFRRETLLHLLEQRKCPRELLQDMIASLEVRAGWRKSVAQYSAERIKSRFCNRNGPIRQQGFDHDNKPIVWVLRGLESRARDWSSEKVQEEYARSLLWAVDMAIRRRPVDVNGVVLYICDTVDMPMMNFGKVFATVFCNEAPAFLGLIDCIRFFNPSKSSTILWHLLRHYSKELTFERSALRGSKTWAKWVSNQEHIPQIYGSSPSEDESRSTLSVPLIASVDARLGLERPFAMAHIFNTCHGEVESLYPTQRGDLTSGPLKPKKRHIPWALSDYGSSQGSSINSSREFSGHRKSSGAHSVENVREWQSRIPLQDSTAGFAGTKKHSPRISPRDLSLLCTIRETPSGDMEEIER